MSIHAHLMPSNLALVKPTFTGLCQEAWRNILPYMEDQTKPFADIAARIKWHRSLMQLDQQPYAERAGLKRSQLSNWELGGSRISIDGALRLRETYGLSLDFIYTGNADALPMNLRSALLGSPRDSASK